MRARVLLPIAAALALSACAQGPGTKYNWGGYSQALYDYHKDATERADYMATLVKIVEKDGPTSKVPPGIFAELGYLKLADGDQQGAIALFEREKAAWPESGTLMDRAIAGAREGKLPTKPGLVPASAPADSPSTPVS